MTYTIILLCGVFHLRKGAGRLRERTTGETRNRSTKYVLKKLVSPTLCNEICSPGNNEENRGSSLLHKSERHTLCLKSEICLGGHLSTGVDNED